MISRRRSLLLYSTNTDVKNGISLLEKRKGLILEPLPEPEPEPEPTDLGNGNMVTFYYIESQSGTFIYPIFKTESEANLFDIFNGGSADTSPMTFVADPSGLEYWASDNIISISSSAPINNTFGLTSNISWFEIPTTL